MIFTGEDLLTPPPLGGILYHPKYSLPQNEILDTPLGTLI